MSYWKEIIEGGWSLVEGMRVTVRPWCVRL